MPEVDNIVPAQSERHVQMEGGEAWNEDALSERSPSLDSITHPYRSILNETCFPRYHLPYTPAGTTESYTRSMLVLGNGLPIWDPLGNINRPEKHIKSGVSIGDVGVLDKDGDFECLFNVFLPRNDEIQRRCPPDMVPFLPAPEPSDIATDMNHFPPGTVMVSKSVVSTQLSTSPLHINFEIRAREGGILVLPHGASREDLISTVRLREYIQQHALNWYISMNKHPRTEINFPNGSLYVVTGCDKAHSWAIAAGPHSYLDMGRPFTINYRGDVSPAWRISAGIRCKSTKVVDDSQKYSVFLRGIKVAVSISDWTNYVLQNETPGRLPFYNVLGLRTTGLRAKLQSFIERKRHFPDHYLSPVSEFIFHPSDLLLRFVLEESRGSEVQVAVVEDSVLSESFKTIGDACAEEVIKFVVQVLSTHDIQKQEGLAMLVPNALVSKERESLSRSPLRSLIDIPLRLSRWIHARRQREEIASKLRKFFPGSPIPSYDLTQG